MSRSLTLFKLSSILWILGFLSLSQIGCLSDCGGEAVISDNVCEQCPDRCIQGQNGKNRCVPCINDKQCRTIAGSTKICSKDNRCICGTNADCPKGMQCSGERGCLECFGDSHCTNPDRPFCGENNRCVRCKVGSVQACAPTGDTKVCNQGTQTCRVGGVWSDCKGWLKCTDGQTCKEGQCIQNCPAVTACQLGQKSCVSNPDEPGEYISCVRNEKGCLEYSKKTEPCPGTQVCQNGQCLPKTCSANACKIGEKECTDSKNIRVCVKDAKTGCPVWEESKPCPSGNQCSKDLNTCVVCLPGTKQPCYRGPAKTKDVGLCKSGSQVCAADGTQWGACVGDVLPTKESCNGKDDDCNGQADEGCKCKNGETRACGSDVGECKKGKQSCQNGTWGKCNGQTLPTAEVCNGKDDNCDGKVDETFSTKGQSCSKGVSECQATGKYVCSSDGKSVECDAQAKPPSKEVCDGKDNDCNGKIDDNLTAPDCTKQQGVCKGAKQKCTGQGGWQDCGNAEYLTHASTYEPTETTCDGKDNDCDGKTDANLTKACYTGTAGTDGKGLCKSGTQTCTAGKWDTCKGEVVPTKEVCDGKDNNCDGSVDEGIAPKACYTGTAGTAGKGRCKSGLQVCQNGKFSACAGEVLPTQEICNNIDDNCDGQVDEKLTQSCYTGSSGTSGKGLCKGGTQTCAAGKWGTCAGEVTPSAEVCDNKDNNCDGKVDEGLTKSCYTGPSGTENKGLCKSGTQTCAAGKWGTCTGEVKPTSAEICNGKDNNCDGQVGEGCQCQDGQKRACGTSQGECKEGQQTCSSGKWGTCVGEVKATTETCDGKDNDCDGKVDELFLSKGQTCSVGRGECKASGKFICKTDGSGVVCDAKAGTPSKEVCDNKDNDCDGLIDESVTKTCYSGPSGTAGIGICRAGYQRCSRGTFGSCFGEVKPSTEVCDARDNDCDGKVDEGLTRACYTGKAGTKDVGLCKGGTQSCSAGRWGSCVGQVIPKGEICDKKDNDCDGAIDEGDTCAVMFHLYGPDNQRARGIAIDKNNNFYIVGFYATEINFGTVAKQTSRGSNDGFLAKFNPKGEYLWSVQIGSTGSDTVLGVELDSNGNPVIFGTFQGTVKFGSKSLTSGGGNDIFVSKLDSKGQFLWTTQIKSTANVSVADVELDSSNNPFVFGHYTTTATFGSKNLTSTSGANIYISKLSASNGSFQWTKDYGTTANTPSGFNGLAINKAGELFFSGRFKGTTTLGSKKITSYTSGRFVDGFLAKADKSGTVQWVRHLSSFFDDGGGIAVEVDQKGDVYFGAKISSYFNLGGKRYPGGGFDDTHLLKFNSSGTLLWHRHFDTSVNSAPFGIAFTATNNVYVAGFFNYKLTVSGTSVSGDPRDNAFVAGFKPDGTVLKLRWAGGWGVDRAYDIAVAPSGKIYAVGDFERNFADRVVKFGPRNLRTKGAADGFVWEITPP